MVQTLVQVLCGTGFTFLMTTLGAAVVFCFRGAISDKLNCAFLAACLAAGLNVPIVNTESGRIRDTLAAMKVLTGADRGCGAYISRKV